MKFSLKYRKLLVLGLYVLTGVALGVGVMLVSFSKTSLKEKEYPELSILSQTNQLTCELTATSYVGALNNCEERKLVVNSKFAEPELQEESLRLTYGPGSPNDPRKNEREVEIPKILWRREGEALLIKNDHLIQELEDKQVEDKYLVTHESEKYLIGSRISESNLATESATVFLDKKEGLLTQTTSRSTLYCTDSLTSYSSLYRCY